MRLKVIAEPLRIDHRDLVSVLQELRREYGSYEAATSGN